MTKRILIAAGNPNATEFRGGQPYYFLRAARQMQFLDGALPLDPNRMLVRRSLWNLVSLLRYGTPFGFQYSSVFANELLAPFKKQLSSVEFISYFPPLPPMPWPSSWKINYYIDATLRQNFNDYGIGTRIGLPVQRAVMDHERRNYLAAQRIVCRSRWAAASVVADYGIDLRKVHVILPGASFDDEVGANGEAAAPISLRPLRLGMVGCDWRRKGLGFLLAVADALQARGLAVEVAIIGPRPATLPSHAALRALGYVSKRNMTTICREIRSWHFGSLFSSAEALPSFLRESLRLGVPVLARRVGGIPETVPDGLGYLFEPEAAPDEVADLLAGFVAAPDRYWQLRARVAARAEEFSWRRTVESFIALWQGSDAFSYERVVGRHG